jgi:hypothetical protein
LMLTRAGDRSHLAVGVTHVSLAIPSLSSSSSHKYNSSPLLFLS